MKHTSKLLALLAVALLLPNGACNDPLHVSIPTIVPPGSLSDSAALGTLRAGAIGDFSIAFSGDAPDGDGGTGEGVIMYGGLLADEWLNSETFPTRIEVDARTIQVTNADVDLWRSEEHTSELQSRRDLVCRLLLEKKKKLSQRHNPPI